MTSIIFHNMLPVIAACIAGIILARTRRIDLPTLGTIVIYCIAPIVNFDAVLKIKADAAMFALPLLTFTICAVNSVLTSLWSKRLLHDQSAGLLVASSASSANTLYFGLGIAMAVLPPDLVPVFLLCCIGPSLSETIFGYYFLARSRFDWRDATRRVVKLPVLYAVAFAICCHALGLDRPDWLTPLAANSRGALIMLGSMILGVGLGQEKNLHFNPGLVAAVLFSRHITYALLTMGFLLLDLRTLHMIAPEHHHVFLLFILMPIANNTLTFASLLGLPTGPIGSTILASNIASLGLTAGIYAFDPQWSLL